MMLLVRQIFIHGSAILLNGDTFAVVIVKAVVEKVQLKVSILLVHRWNQNPKGEKCKVQNNEYTLLASQ